MDGWYLEVYNYTRILIGKPEVKRPLIRPRHRWETKLKLIS
jgi:hypothetical protein